MCRIHYSAPARLTCFQQRYPVNGIPASGIGLFWQRSRRQMVFPLVCRYKNPCRNKLRPCPGNCWKPDDYRHTLDFFQSPLWRNPSEPVFIRSQFWDNIIFSNLIARQRESGFVVQDLFRIGDYICIQIFFLIIQIVTIFLKMKILDFLIIVIEFWCSWYLNFKISGSKNGLKSVAENCMFKWPASG